jgi:CheY-like chemotaxis protein
VHPLEILLVEDNAADVVLTRYALLGCPNSVILHTAQDGEEALKMLSDPSFKPDLIILDLNLPRVDGHTVLERFERHEVPVVVFSSTGNQAEMQRAMALGARDCVRKPIDLQPFTDAIRGIVQRWTPATR